jgi:competence protein ComEC
MAAPALFVAIPLVLGILLGTSHGGYVPFVTPALVLTWTFAAIATWWSTRSSRPNAARASVALICAGCLGAGVRLGADARRVADRPSLLAWFEQNGGADRPVHLVGILREDAAKTGTAVSLALDATRVDGRPVDGGVRISVGGTLALDTAPQWRAGRTLTIDLTLRTPLDYRDPGVPSDRERLARQGIVLFGTAKSAALVSVVANGGLVSEAAASLRARVRASTASAVGRWSPASAGVVTAILIGDRTGLNPDDERRLQEAGTYHVIAISGGNIALLTLLLVAIGRTARLPARPTAAGAIGVLAFYGYMAGLAPSVLRATVAGMVYLAARASDHRGTALNAIGVAAVSACVTAPLSVLDPGFMLSFGATFAILIAASRLAPRLAAHREERTAPWWRRAARAIGLAARGLGAATICAEIALAPAGARLFGRVSVAGLLLNFAAIPLMSIIQVAGLAAVAFAPVPILAPAAGWIAHTGTVALLRSASLVDVAPWLVLDVPSPAAWTIAFWYAGWAAILGSRRRALRWCAGLSIMVAVCAVAIGLPAARSDRVAAPSAGWTRFVVLDVGQGDATLVMPAGALPFLVDAGGAPGSSFDVGRRVALPAVWAFGARRLSALVLTHGDPDHVGGAPALLRALAPSEVWDGVPVPRHEPMQRLRAAADRAGIPWVTRRAGETLAIGRVTLRVLNPPPPDWERPRVRNDDSVVLEARVGDFAMLLPGDITQAVEADVLARFDPAPLVIVRAPHHGSAGSSSPRFVMALHPTAVVFSAGRRNPFGHPAPVVVDRYRAAGARVFSTADDGCVVIDTDGQSVVVWTALGRRETFPSSGTTRADGSPRRR